MKNFDITPKVKFYLLFLCTMPFIILFAWIFWDTFTDERTDEEIYLSFKVDIECIGTVDSIYRQVKKHNILALKTQGCVFDVPDIWENKFRLGDSISKKSGKLHIEHYRNGVLLEGLRLS